MITFNLGLTTQALLATNWLVRQSNTLYRPTFASSAGYDVTLTDWINLGANVGTDACTYLASPPDVQTPAGGYAAAFMDYPTTVS